MLLILSAWVLSCSLDLSDPPDRPPRLTFDKHVDYVGWYNDFVSRGKKENAYELYKPLEQASEGPSVVPGPPWPVGDQLDRALQTVWKAEEYAALATYLQKNRRFVEAFKKTQERHDYWQPFCAEGERLLNMRMLQLDGMRTMARIILADAMREQPNQTDVLIQTWELVLGNADHLRQSQIGVLQVSGARTRETVYDMVRVALARKLIQGKDIERAFTTIIRADAGEAPSPGWCMNQWAAFLDAMQALSPDGRPFQVKVQRTTDPVRGEGRGPPEYRLCDPVKVAKLADEHFVNICNALSGPFDVRTARELDRLDQEHRETLKANGETPSPYVWHAVTYHRFLRAEAQRRATLLCLAMHAHKETRGEWPRSLDEIAPSFGREAMKGLLGDPYSGKTFVYLLKDSQPLLYSVGADGDDDEGRHDARWGESSSGGDFVFWPYQEPLSTRF